MVNDVDASRCVASDNQHLFGFVKVKFPDTETITFLTPAKSKGKWKIREWYKLREKRDRKYLPAKRKIRHNSLCL